MQDTTSEYPIDTRELHKGSIIAPEIIERAFGVKRETRAYQLALLRARNYIERRFLDRDEVVTIVTRRDAIVILLDEEASVYNEREFWNDIDAARRKHGRMLGTNRANLSDARIDSHDRATETQGRVLAAVRQARKEPPKIGPTPRNTPALRAGTKG